MRKTGGAEREQDEGTAGCSDALTDAEAGSKSAGEPRSFWNGKEGRTPGQEGCPHTSTVSSCNL